MEAEHEKELNSFTRTPAVRIIYALGMLADVIEADMVGEERDSHISDAREIIGQALAELDSSVIILRG